MRRRALRVMSDNLFDRFLRASACKWISSVPGAVVALHYHIVGLPFVHYRILFDTRFGPEDSSNVAKRVKELTHKDFCDGPVVL